MSEFTEPRWSVSSERGREASSLPYAEAARLVKQLQSERVHGLCIITDEAAQRLDKAASSAEEFDIQPAKTPAEKRATLRRER